MIRPVMPKDVFQIAELAKQLHSESRYKNFKFNKKKIINNILWLMAQSLFVCFVEEKADEKISGFIAGYVDTYFFSDDYLLADRGFYVLPKYRKDKTAAKLLRAYIDAGRKLKVKEICMCETTTDDPNYLALLYKKVGFEKVGSLYKITV